MVDLETYRERARKADAEVHPFHVVGEPPVTCNAVLLTDTTPACLFMLDTGEEVSRTADELWDIGNFPQAPKPMPMYEPNKPINATSPEQERERLQKVA